RLVQSASGLLSLLFPGRHDAQRSSAAAGCQRARRRSARLRGSKLVDAGLEDVRQIVLDSSADRIRFDVRSRERIAGACHGLGPECGLDYPPRRNAPNRARAPGLPRISVPRGLRLARGSHICRSQRHTKARLILDIRHFVGAPTQEEEIMNTSKQALLGVALIALAGCRLQKETAMLQPTERAPATQAEVKIDRHDNRRTGNRQLSLDVEHLPPP